MPETVEVIAAELDEADFCSALIVVVPWNVEVIAGELEEAVVGFDLFVDVPENVEVTAVELDEACDNGNAICNAASSPATPPEPKSADCRR